MTRSTLNAPTLPSQATIDAGLNRGRQLRSHAIVDAVGALFASPRRSNPATDF